ncbi:MAG TPA: benzoate-CoA ligase family protein [Ktedonobacterales bacterium]|nr:benzoate-CoA ligase family protein [Ktedonobacterales bacterium]
MAQEQPMSQAPAQTATAATTPGGAAGQPADGAAYNAATAFIDGALAAGWGERVALRVGADQWMYARLAAEVNRVGNALAGLGVEMEQRVALLLFDSPEFSASFFGAMKIGAVAVPLNTSMRPQDYAYLLGDSRARVLVVEADLWPQIAPLRPQLPFLRQVVVVRRGAANEAPMSRDGSWDYATLVGSAATELAAAPTVRDDAAFWLYSSGSTGFPKGCVHRHQDMSVCANLYAKPILGITGDDITFSAAKLYFAYGLGNGLYFPLAVGASAVQFPGRMTAEVAFQVIHEQRPTIFFGSPTLYAGMLALPDTAQRFDTSSLRLCVSAGESLPPDIFTRWKERFGVEILDGIGSTEILHIFISSRAGAVKPGSTGKLVPGYQALIADEQGQPMPRGEIGNLLIAGASTCTQYWNKHDRTRTTILGPWIKTGDKYYQDEDGDYWYCGRSDDMLKVSGQWVSPVEVEAALISRPEVLEAAVVGHEDADKLVKPYAFVILKPGVEASPAMEETLKQHVKATLLSYKYPRWIEFTAALPMTSTGKIQRYKLRELLAEREV